MSIEIKIYYSLQLHIVMKIMITQIFCIYLENKDSEKHRFEISYVTVVMMITTEVGMT